ADVLSHLAAGCVVLVAAFGLFARGVIGGGDAQLAAGSALWLRLEQLLPHFLFPSPLRGGLGGAAVLVRLGAPPALAGAARLGGGGTKGGRGCTPRTPAAPRASPLPPRRLPSTRRRFRSQRDRPRAVSGNIPPIYRLLTRFRYAALTIS